MFSLSLSIRRCGSAACLIFGLTAAGELLLPGASLAGQPSVSPCQQSMPLGTAASAGTQAGSGAASATFNDSGSWLAQALPSQPTGPDMGEPVCTYDPPLPAKRQVIRGLW